MLQVPALSTFGGRLRAYHGRRGESAFDFADGTWETAKIAKEGSWYENYPLLEWGGGDEK